MLVVLAVAGFPLVFDTQPRPVPSDLAIDIPSKAKQASEVPPAPLSAHSGAAAQATGAAAPAEPHDPKQSLTEKEELVSSDAKSTPAVPAPVAKPAADKVDPVKPEVASNASKAMAEARFVVQADAAVQHHVADQRDAEVPLLARRTRTWRQLGGPAPSIVLEGAAFLKQHLPGACPP